MSKFGACVDTTLSTSKPVIVIIKVINFPKSKADVISQISN